jgi:hypothetical protein
MSWPITTSEVCKRLSVSEGKIRYLFRVGAIERPASIGGVFFWQAGDYALLKMALAERKERRKRRRK